MRMPKTRIYREGLLLAAAEYLANPWLQDDQIDWILIDSLILAELSAYRESILSGQALGKINWEYIFISLSVSKYVLTALIIKRFISMR